MRKPLFAATGRTQTLLDQIRSAGRAQVQRPQIGPLQVDLGGVEEQEEAAISPPSCAVTTGRVMAYGWLAGIAGGGTAGYFAAPKHRVIGAVVGVAAGLAAWFFGSSAMAASCLENNPEWAAFLTEGDDAEMSGTFAPSTSPLRIFR
jgi:hypothetical protein